MGDDREQREGIGPGDRRRTADRGGRRDGDARAWHERGHVEIPRDDDVVGDASNDWLEP